MYKLFNLLCPLLLHFTAYHHPVFPSPPSISIFQLFYFSPLVSTFHHEGSSFPAEQIQRPFSTHRSQRLSRSSSLSNPTPTPTTTPHTVCQLLSPQDDVIRFLRKFCLRMSKTKLVGRWTGCVENKDD
jgi:hypothetical protein